MRADDKDITSRRAEPRKLRASGKATFSARRAFSRDYICYIVIGRCACRFRRRDQLLRAYKAARGSFHARMMPHHAGRQYMLGGIADAGDVARADELPRLQAVGR